MIIENKEKDIRFEVGNSQMFDKWLAEHDKKIKDEAIIETLEAVIKMIGSWGYKDLTSVVLRENIKARIALTKGVE